MENLNNSDQTAAVPVAARNDKGLSLRGFFEVFYKPGKFFENLKNNPKIIIPYILLLILSFIMMYLVLDVMLKIAMESDQLRDRLQGQPVPPQLEKIISINVLAGGVLAIILTPLLAAALAIFFGNFVMAGKARFKQILSVMIYGELLYIVGGLISAVLIAVQGKFMSPFSLGVLAINQGIDSIAFIALSKIDLFNIWEIIVVGIGLAAVYGFNRKKGYVLSVLSMGILSILHIIFAAIGKLLG